MRENLAFQAFLSSEHDSFRCLTPKAVCNMLTLFSVKYMIVSGS